jgi:chromosome partitioning protein
MPFRRRNRQQPASQLEPEAEERFFEEADPEGDDPAPQGELEAPSEAQPEPEPEVVADAQPIAVRAEEHSVPAPVESEPEPEVVADAQPEPQPEPAPPVDPPPLPADPGRSRQPEGVSEVTEQVEPSEAPELEHTPAHARPQDNFAERAQMAISKLGDLPASNGAVHRPRPLPRVVAIANQKGGVGKTTTTVNLGAALSELDYRVLVVDLDPQGNATSGLGIDTRNFESSMYDVIMRDAPIEDCIEPTSVQNLFVTPATIDLAGVEIELVSAFSRELKLKRAIDTVVDDFDFVLIDCPPSLGLLTINGLAAASEVMVPIQCEYYALEGLSQLLRNVQLVATNLNMGLEISAIVLTMFDARTRLAVDVADEVRTHFKEVVCRSIIPRTVRLSEAPSFGQPITVFDPSSRGAVAYRELAKEVSDGAPKRSG